MLNLLATMRKVAGLTQVTVAERLSRPQYYFAKMEGGERRLDVVEFVALIEALDGESKETFAAFVDKARM